MTAIALVVPHGAGLGVGLGVTCYLMPVIMIVKDTATAARLGIIPTINSRQVGSTGSKGSMIALPDQCPRRRR